MKGNGSEGPWTTLYRVHWIEEGEQKKGSIRGPRMAFKQMESLLQRGIPSWMVPVPFEDDDIPF